MGDSAAPLFSIHLSTCCPSLRYLPACMSSAGVALLDRVSRHATQLVQLLNPYGLCAYWLCYVEAFNKVKSD